MILSFIGNELKIRAKDLLPILLPASHRLIVEQEKPPICFANSDTDNPILTRAVFIDAASMPPPFFLLNDMGTPYFKGVPDVFLWCSVITALIQQVTRRGTPEHMEHL